MKVKDLIRLSILSSIVLLFTGCTKEPGIGGKASIVGTVQIFDYNGLGTFLGEYAAQDYDVFLVYGDSDEIIDDDTKTSHDGSFEFKYLNKGNYKLFVYSDYSPNCTSCPVGGDSVVLTQFEITETKATVNLGQINVRK